MSDRRTKVSLSQYASRAFSPLDQRRVFQRYAIAFGMAVLSVLLRWLLEPALGHTGFYATLYMGVVVSALICGLGPAILCAVTGALGIVYWFVDPRHSLLIPEKAEIHGMVGCVLVCGVLIALGETNRRKQLSLNAAHNELEQRIEERTAELSRALERLASEVRTREEAEEGLRNLSLHLMTVQDEERRRVARELHDTAGQTLAAMKMTLASIRRAGPNTTAFERLADDLDGLAEGALREIRTASYLLHPPMLDEAGFASAARWFVEGFSKRSGIEVRLSLSDEASSLQSHVDLVLFRILQEALTNVHRHANATSVEVRLASNDGQIVFQVSDNGSGLTPERLKAMADSHGALGVGIAGMRERVRELAGRFEIRSDKRGTVVTAIIPQLAARRASANAGADSAA
jgi:signal transduction histidine kinase